MQIVIYAVCLSVILFFASSYFLYCNDAYLRSDFISIVPRVEGYVTKIYAKNNQLVKKDALLLEIDPTIYQLNVDSLAAQVDAAQLTLQSLMQNYQITIESKVAVDSDYKLASDTLNRYEYLTKDNFVSKEQIEQLQSNQQVLSENYKKALIQITQANLEIKQQKANIAKLNADLANSQYMLSMTKIKASIDGYINNLELSIGDYVSPGSSIFGLTGSENWRVIANYKQADLAHIKIGATAIIYIPNFPWRLSLGKVVALGHAVARNSTSDNPSLPYIEPVTDWIRYPYRFPVYIELDSPPPAEKLYMGMDIYSFIIP